MRAARFTSHGLSRAQHPQDGDWLRARLFQGYGCVLRARVVFHLVTSWAKQALVCGCLSLLWYWFSRTTMSRGPQRPYTTTTIVRGCDCDPHNVDDCPLGPRFMAS